ncbi:MAG: sodium:solute symporter family protein [Synergistaceae bacterium]|jgi:sodium/pantothenate symporter|nr:sodium:solute symporter family protein [Synergistaceae bacterium]
MNVFVIAVFASLIVYLVVGYFVGRNVKNVDDYYVAGRSAPVFLIVGSLVASYISTGAFLGETGETASGAFMPVMIVGVMQCTGYLFGSNLFGRYIRRSQCLTIPEYFGARFQSVRMRKLSAIIMVISVTAYMLSVTQGISTLMSSLTGMSYKSCVVIAWASFTIFTIWSGSPGVLVTDTMMFCVFIVAAVIAIPSVFINVGGWDTAIANLANSTDVPGIISATGSPEYIASTGQTTLWAIFYGVVWIFVVMISPWQTSRYMMAKDEHVVMRSAIWASLGVIITTSCLYFTGAFITLKAPGLGTETIIYASFNMMPRIVGVVLLTGILAAGISSGSTFLSLCGFAVTNDLFIKKDKTDEKSLLRFSRNGMLVVSLCVLVMAYFNPPAIFWVMYFGGAVIAGSWALVSISSIWSKNISEKGAFYGMLLGFIGCFFTRLGEALGFFTIPTMWLDSFAVGIYLSVIGVLAGNKLSAPTAAEIAERKKMFVVPESEKDPVRMWKTYRLWRVYACFAFLFAIIMVTKYAIPYLNALR